MGLAVSVGWASGGQAGGTVAACSPHSCSPCENREVTPDGHTCPIDFDAAETVDYKSSLSKAPYTQGGGSAKKGSPDPTKRAGVGNRQHTDLHF